MAADDYDSLGVFSTKPLTVQAARRLGTSRRAVQRSANQLPGTGARGHRSQPEGDATDSLPRAPARRAGPGPQPPARTRRGKVGILARRGDRTEVPLGVISTRENPSFLGTNIKEIQDRAPTAYGNRMARVGQLNASLDPRFVERSKLSGGRT